MSKLTLQKYLEKRNFAITPEPEGFPVAGIFCVQKHDASHLHWDFRLQIGDVLKSWALPKGVPMTGRHLAMETEDHPYEYAWFKGTIPKGQYGAGTVERTDLGFWRCVDPQAAYEAGHIKFQLVGDTFNGNWALIKTAGKQANAWLLVKEVKDTPFVFDPVAHVTVTHEDRVLLPKWGFRKKDLLEYYDTVASLLLPHVVYRPLMLVRCPQGLSGDCFIQKSAEGLSPHIHAGDSYVYVKDKLGLEALAQYSVLEVHSWNCLVDDLDKPDRIVFDLDPGQNTPWVKVCEVALAIRNLLRENGLDQSFIKHSGSKGLHVVVPVVPRADWKLMGAWIRAFVDKLHKMMPKLIVTGVRDKRDGKVYLDVTRNTRGSTTISVWSPRAMAIGPISVPLSWSDVVSSNKPTVVTVKSYQQFLQKATASEWKGYFDVTQTCCDLSSGGTKS